MNPGSTTVSSAKKAIMSQHALLESLVAIATKHFNEQIIGVGTRMVAGLLDVGSEAVDARLVYQRVKSGNLLKENNYAYVHLASTELELALRRELEQLVPSLKKSRPMLAELSLVPFEEMDNKVAFDAIARPFEFKYAAPIATLNVRLGVTLDREILRTPQNPFRPDLFLTVLQQAWREFEPDEQAHELIIPLLTPEMLFDFGPMYQALCDALTKTGARPGSAEALTIRKTESAAAAKQARARQKAELARQLRQFLAEDENGKDADLGIPMIPDLPNLPDAKGGWRPSAAEGFGAPQALAVTANAAGGHAAAAGDPRFTRPAQGFAGPAHGAAASASGFPGPVHGFVPGGHGSVEMGLAQGHAQGHAQGPGGHGAHAAPVGGYPAAAGGFADGGGTGQLMDLLNNLQARVPEQMKLGMQRMAGAGGEGGAPTAPGANIFYLPRLKESMPKGSLSRGDESTIDLLSKIFDTVFIDPNIPSEIRELMQFLQIPVLRAALADKNFFFEEAHPARRMIDLMSRIGMEQRKAPDDPLFQAMRRSVDRVGREADEQGAAFSEALAELEQSVQEDDAVAQNAIAAPIAAALKQEKVTAATRSARTAVAARVGSGEVVAMLETFLEHKWTSVLTLAYSVEDDKPGAVNNATKTMDDLIWSVKPKITREERKSLIARLPGLLAALNRWLDVIKWQDAERTRFFAELAECHASIVRAPLDITPERQLEIAVEVAQADALRRLEKEQAAASAPVTEIDDSALAIEALERNQWLEFAELDGSPRKAKLAWISPLRTLFIFSTGARQEAFSVPVEKLQAAFRERKVQVMRVDGLVGRALSAAMNDTGLGEIPMLSSVAA